MVVVVVVVVVVVALVGVTAVTAAVAAAVPAAVVVAVVLTVAVCAAAVVVAVVAAVASAVAAAVDVSVCAAAVAVVCCYVTFYYACFFTLRFRNYVLQLFVVVLHDFTQLLEQQATIDQYAEWASKLVDTCIKVRNFVELKPLVCAGTTCISVLIEILYAVVLFLTHARKK